jgi:hypothetical protein
VTQGLLTKEKKMGEYAKYNGKEIKIGTCENMYYLRADQRVKIQPLPGNVNPARDKEARQLRFRFPWPDEDQIEPGDFEDYERYIVIPKADIPDEVDHGSLQFTNPAGYLVSLPCPESKDATRIRILLDDNIRKPITIGRNAYPGKVKLVQQRLLEDGRLVPVFQCNGCGHKWRLEDPEEIETIAKLLENFRTPFSEEVASRIRKGANL